MVDGACSSATECRRGGEGRGGKKGESEEEKEGVVNRKSNERE